MVSRRAISDDTMADMDNLKREFTTDLIQLPCKYSPNLDSYILVKDTIPLIEKWKTVPEKSPLL